MNKNVKKNFVCRALIVFLVVFSITLCSGKTISNAYVLNGWKLSNPKNVKIHLGYNTSGYNVATYAKKWQTYCSEIKMTTVSSAKNANILYSGVPTIDNGTYGVTYHNSNNVHSVSFYKAFYKASAAVRNETIVHETGHALGLAHTQTSKNSKAVMRATGFNYNAKPLSDDRAGIKKLY